MAFDSDYWHALDKQSAENLEVSPKDIGISMGAGDVLEGLKSAINMGAGTVELGFTGAAKGSLGQGSTTPEMFGSDKREAIRQMAKINEVNVTTHATVSTQGLAGFDQRSGFSDTAAATSLHEIKRAIDFAADTTRGGPVTIHTGEFPREIREAPGGLFEPYHLKEKEIPKEEIVALVDKRTGKLMPFQKGQVVWEPKWEKDSKGNFLDWEGKPLTGEDKWSTLKRKPETNPSTGEVEFEQKDWNYVVDETRKWNEEHLGQKQVTPGQRFLMKMRESEIQRQKPYMLMWEERYKDYEKREKSLSSVYEEIVREKYEDDPRQIEIVRKQVSEMLGHPLPHDVKPSEFLKKNIDNYQRMKEYEREGWIGMQKELKEVERLKDDVVPMEQFGIERSARNIAQAAMYAYEKEKQMKLEKPLFVSPENIFPETGYGSHPEELKRIVLESRKAMTQELEHRGYGSSEARQIAEDHVKATFDVGHAYTWKKFFRAEPGESFEQTEKRFNNWMLKEVDKLNEAGIIGHVHLSDNFGYYDEHLTPGTGSVPLKEFVEKMRKSGHMEPMIAEGGAQAKEEYYQAMTGGWKSISSSPIYRTAKWSDIEDSYFGRVSSPTYIVGKYAPSQEYLGSEKGAPFWSGVGLE
ncbi:MAG: TIM barrel protein [Nanoarchaeota archaeon]|nr:TIM barrel protein [Nanoarchaeota archaeon]